MDITAKSPRLPWPRCSYATLTTRYRAPQAAGNGGAPIAGEQCLREVLAEAAKPTRRAAGRIDRSGRCRHCRENPALTYPSAEEADPGTGTPGDVRRRRQRGPGNGFVDDEPNGAEALHLVRSGEALIAPDLLIAETSNCWKLLGGPAGRQMQLDRIATVLPGLFAELAGAAPLAPRAVAIAAQLDRPVYDCFYLALSEARQVPFVTADTRLLARLAGSPWAVRAVHVADYPGRTR